MDILVSDGNGKLVLELRGYEELTERLRSATGLNTAKFDMMDHDAFMERAKKAFAVVQTGETALYGNIGSSRQPERARRRAPFRR